MESQFIKAIVVDDELNARKLLPMLLDWGALGYQFIGEASNGSEALDLIEALRPDVVFTDINMPFMDGLELSGKIKEQAPLTKIVILTAYPEFEYAQRSVQLGVSNFLLKPLSAVQVLELAEALAEKIRKETEHWQEYCIMQEQLSVNAVQMKEQFIHELLFGSAQPELLDQRYYYFYSEPFGSFGSVAVLEADKGLKTEETRMMLSLGCMRMVETLLGGEPSIDTVHDSNGRIVLLSRSRKIDLTKVGEQCIRAIQDKLNIQASVGVSTPCASLNRVKDAYREAIEALRYGKHAGGGQVIYFGEDIRLNRNFWDMKLPELDEIMFYIKGGQKKQAEEAIERLFQELNKERRAAIEQCQAVTIHFVSLLTVELSGLGFEKLRAEWLSSPVYNEVFSAGTYMELKDLMARLASHAVDYILQSRIKKKNIIIEEVKKYIAQEMGNPELSLAMVSRTFNLNASYLSRIFKQETGQGFTEYLLKVRMVEAVKLLNETDWKAYQIADKVGIKDPYYFSHCFKKVMGISIQEYKRIGNIGGVL